MTWSPKTGSTDSRPRVPELVRSENDDPNKPGSSGLHEMIPNYENHPIPQATPYPPTLLPPPPPTLPFNGEIHHLPPPLPPPTASEKEFQTSYPQHAGSPIFPQQLIGCGEGGGYEDSGEESIYSNSVGFFDDIGGQPNHH